LPSKGLQLNGLLFYRLLGIETEDGTLYTPRDHSLIGELQKQKAKSKQNQKMKQRGK